ncbi:MAG: hypothetical protein ACREK1_05460 [Longimicrobiales bacterium]
MAEMTVGNHEVDAMDWKTAILAGVIAGVVFLVMEMMLMPLFGFAPNMWAPPRMIAAIGLGEGVLPMPEGPPPTFDFMVVMVAMMIHFATSILFAVVVSYIIRRMPMGAAIALGIVAALLLYGFVFYVMAAGPWPWFAMGRNWVNIMTHVVFGAIVAWWYKARAHAGHVHTGMATAAR